MKSTKNTIVLSTILAGKGFGGCRGQGGEKIHVVLKYSITFFKEILASCGAALSLSQFITYLAER